MDFRFDVAELRSRQDVLILVTPVEGKDIAEYASIEPVSPSAVQLCAGRVDHELQHFVDTAQILGANDTAAELKSNLRVGASLAEQQEVLAHLDDVHLVVWGGWFAICGILGIVESIRPCVSIEGSFDGCKIDRND